MASWWTNPIAFGTNRERPVTGEQHVGQSSSQSSAGLTVVFTTVPGTMAALERATRLARDLDLCLTLLVPQVVPYQVPVTCPPVAIGHTQQTILSMLSASALNAHDINVQICLCRDRIECLSRWMGARSMVFVGRRSRWWPSQERKLERTLRALGYEVIVVEQEEHCHA